MLLELYYLKHGCEKKLRTTSHIGVHILNILIPFFWLSLFCYSKIEGNGNVTLCIFISLSVKKMNFVFLRLFKFKQNLNNVLPS